MSALSCPAALVDQTLEELRVAGRDGTERVVLWLSPRPLAPGPMIVETCIPEQEAEVDFFRIPPSSMKTLMAHLRERKLALAAQIHSHPERAFHSHRDDKWAIVRREGALSIVVPNFAVAVTATNFLDSVAVFRLTAEDRWQQIEADTIGKFLRLT